MKADELTIEVKAGLSVDRDQACRCLKIIEWYLNDNQDYLVIRRQDDGEISLNFTSIEDSGNESNL